MSFNKNSSTLKKRDRSLLERVQLLVDSNIRVIQNGLYLIGAAGLVLAARSIHLAKMFRTVEEIPAKFICKQVKLRGRVRKVSDEGTLDIEHIPIMRLPLMKHTQTTDCLPVHMACIDLSPEARLWLTNNVLQKVVWFHLLHRTSSNDGMAPQLYSKIELPQKFRRNILVNEKLIKEGLSKISSLSSLEEAGKMPTNQNLLLYLDRLVQLEQHASQKGTGMWTQPKEKSLGRKGLGAVTSVLSSPYKVVKWIYGKRKRKK